MKYNSLWKLKSFLSLPIIKSQIKYVSNKAEYPALGQTDSPVSISQSNGKKRYFYAPELPRKTLQGLDSITSIVIALNRVSWAKISIEKPTILNWDLQSLPGDFIGNMIETNISQIAFNIRKKIPDSGLYVMETGNHRWTRNPNELTLRAMLILLLEASSNGSKEPKVVFQNPYVMNVLHSLRVGGERISVRQVLQKYNLLKSPEAYDTESASLNDIASKQVYPWMNLQNENLQYFWNCSNEEQESLCISLLLSMTFLDIVVFQTQESLKKLQEKKSPKSINCPPH